MTKDSTKDAKPKGKWWVLQQHDKFETKRGEERPDSKDVPHERKKRVHGPFDSEEKAEARIESLKDRHTSHRMRSRSL